MKKKILFFSGSRAEYSLIKPFYRTFSKLGCDCKFIIAGSHLSNNFGNTLNDFKKDKIKIFKKINLKINTNKLNDIIDYSSKLQLNINELFKKHKFDYTFLSSDRFETFAAAIVSFANNVPIIHYEGGEITEGGSLDDNIRHSISKISHIHFVTNEKSKKILYKMGENKEHIFNTGYSSLFYSSKKNLVSKKKIYNFFKIKENEKIILINMHPIAFSKTLTINEIKNVLEALKFIDHKIYKIIFTYPNFDPNYQIILSQINHFMKLYKNSKLIPHLGTQMYHSLMYYFGKDKLGFCIGNSSSLIKEAPFFNCPSIIIGNRQKGRYAHKKLVFATAKKKSIIKKINEITKFVYPKTTPINFKHINLEKVIKKTIHLRSKKNFLLKNNFF
jgi:UDP-hydrolysing UDP-N-acetyl-D-glucosamine 2-epimerase